jgi:PAS domain S-box-containing protein
VGDLVLNVDDYEPQRHARSAVLRAAGLTVMEAATGREALALARDHRPALVLLDVHLPDIDGLEVCRTLKADPVLETLFVLQVSATCAERAKALDNGADVFLAEPVEPAELLAQVKALLRLAAIQRENRRVREALQESRARLRSFFDAPGVLMTVAELESDDIVYLTPNASLAAYFGMSVQGLSGKRARRDLGVPGDQVDGWLAAFHRCLADGRPLTWEYSFAFGQRAGFYQTTISQTDGGVHPRFAVTIVDITERKQAELVLDGARRLAEAREAEIASLYDAAPIGLCIFDREGRYLRINRRLAELNGVPAEEHRGRTLREIVPDIADQAEALLRQVVETNRPALGVEIAGEVPSMPGITRTWLENWFPVCNAEGQVVAINVAAEEITELKRVQEQLQQANQVKDDFLATLSHELRTPLTAILGWASLLGDGRLDAVTARQALDAILRNAEIQRQLVTDVLDVSRMMNGKVRLQLGEVDPLDVVNRAVASVRQAIDAKQIRLEVTSNAVGGAILADQDRLHQVVWNLVSNAVKFTPEKGEIRILLQEEGGELRIVVNDTGEGISPEFLPKVFDRFAQADTSVSRRHAGLGLGLAIVKNLVELHGGRVDVFSAGQGQGATFTVTLPIAPRDTRSSRFEAHRRQESQAPRDLRGTRVLVVDDVRDTRDLLRTIVERAGGVVVVADSGHAALALLALWRPDVILADLGMPEMSGYDFIERLRALPAEDACRVPVIALTAYGSRSDVERTLRAGFAEHVSKPIIPAEVVAALLRVTARGAGASPRPPLATG